MAAQMDLVSAFQLPSASAVVPSGMLNPQMLTRWLIHIADIAGLIKPVGWREGKGPCQFDIWGPFSGTSQV